MARLGWVAGALLALAVACGGGGGGDTGPDTGGDGGGGGDTGGDGGGDKGGGVVPDPPLVSGAFSFFGAAQGLSPDVRDVSADEGGNVYVAAWDALYVKARGASAFTRVDSAAAGLSTTCWPASEIGNPSPPGAPGVCPIISVAGAAPGTAVVGYKGVGTDYDYDAPWALDSGGMDVVRLQGGAVTRVRRVFVASPPQTVCEHWADAPRNSVCAENWSDSTWMAGRKKMRQIQRIVVNHDASRPLSYGDVYMGGTHGSLGILVANPAARGWVDKTAGHPAFADAQHVWEHHHPNPPSTDGQFLAGETWALALHPTLNVPFYANQFRIGSMPRYASMPRPDPVNNWWGDQDPPEPGLLALWYPALPQNPDLRDNVQSLSFCDDGTLWAGSAEHGLARVGPNGDVSYVDLPPNLGNSALAVACDPSDDSVWVGFGWGGFGRYRDGGWWTVGTDAPRFAWQNPVRSIQIDRWSSPRVVYFAHTTSRFGPGGVTAYDGP
jgi:hypothetical protein